MSRFAYLIMVNGEENRNNNKFYKMTEQSDGTIAVEYGRVDATKQTTSYPISKWDSLIKSKVKKGYKDITDLVAVEEVIEKTADGKEKVNYISDDNEVRKLIEQLQSWAKATIQQNYKVSTSKVTQKMVDTAQDLIDKLTKQYKDNEDYKILNKTILEIYTTIPRRMSDVKSYLLKSNDKKEIESLIDNEQKLLDTMTGQVLANKAVQEDEQKEEVTNKPNSLLEQLGLEIKYVEDKDVLYKISKMMGDSSHLMGKVYEVTNIKTEERYIKTFYADKNSKEDLLWHGSRNQNWFNILQTGLLIRPSGAIYTGSMFSDGLYFANKARKSIGYTSLSGSYWASGNNSKSLLAIFKVNVGNQKHIYKHDSSCYNITEKNLLPYNSVYAHGGADLRNDEFIVYNPNRCTIKYLVEIRK